MVITSVLLVLEFVVVFGNIYLTADYGLHRGVLRSEFEELLDTVHIAVVSDCETRHAEFFSPLEQVCDRRLAIQD